jgi:DNA-binding CsgD family transcriptional regulator
MKTLLAMTFLSAVLASPAFAQMSAADMTCSDFGTMDSSSQMAAVGAMGDQMRSGAMSSGGMMPSSSTSDGSDHMTPDHMAPNIETVATACDGHPDMMVHKGHKRIHPEVAETLVNHMGEESLTARELAVLKQIATGKANKAIAAQLSISEQTVKRHVKNILGKLHANDRTHAVAIGVKRGIITI